MRNVFWVTSYYQCHGEDEVNPDPLLNHDRTRIRIWTSDTAFLPLKTSLYQFFSTLKKTLRPLFFSRRGFFSLNLWCNSFIVSQNSNLHKIWPANLGKFCPNIVVQKRGKIIFSILSYKRIGRIELMINKKKYFISVLYVQRSNSC